MKYRFEILYANKNMIEVNRLMKCLNLGMDKIGLSEIMTFTSQKDLKICDLKELITQGYESAECEVFKIEGGKVE